MNSQIPFLMRFASLRTPHPPLPGRYSPELDVWVGGEGEEIPIVEMHSGLVELRTKTFADQETDEEDFTCRGLAELTTKTDVQAESDDELHAGLLELETKTSMVPESDDELHRSPILELETKTEQQIEQDDESRPVL
ncbi:MAG TPA: hypothetical protein VK403_11195 [Allosphingosinicella sp.]|nr:hypothetical protein [Allosphingosinicella sp.]